MKIILTLLTALALQVLQAQTHKDYFDKEVQTGQRSTTRQVINHLEKGDLAEIRSLFSPEIENLSTDLQHLSNAIVKVQGDTKYSEVIVFEEGFNIFRCRYYNDEGIQFQIDFYFTEGNKDSEIVKFDTKDSKVLEEEKQQRMKSSKIPPPPGN